MYYRIRQETVEDIASAIRSKNGVTGDIQVQDFAEAILELNVGENTEAAAQSASSALASSVSAASSATAAAKSAGDAAASAQSAINSEIIAKESAEIAVQNAETSNNNRLDAEAWAVGKRDGIDVGVDDVTYENNAAYWAQKTKDLVTFVEMTDDDVQALWDDVFKEGR